MKALKIIGRIILTIFFIALIFCIVLVCTYMLGQPNRDKGTDSRKIITGPWESISVQGEDEYDFVFDQEGNFTIDKNGAQIADGYFKIQGKSSGKGKIKLFMLPGHYTDDFAKYVKFKCLSEISFSSLECNLTETDEIDKDHVPYVMLLLKSTDGSGDNQSIECRMTEVTIDLYNSDKDLTKDDR